jgi:predicted  nucleic acid-binding Zn-ribbon protein
MCGHGDAVLFVCVDCGRAFRTVKAAERAWRNGCPKCGGVDIDLM